MLFALRLPGGCKVRSVRAHVDTAQPRQKPLAQARRQKWKSQTWFCASGAHATA